MSSNLSFLRISRLWQIFKELNRPNTRREGLHSPLHFYPLTLEKTQEFKCRFSPASKSLLTLAKYFEEKDESETDYRNLRMFRDYEKRDQMPVFIKKYFDNKTPVSFYVQGDFKGVDYVSFAKHFNFYTSYYDRGFPHIVIHEKQDVKKFARPCYFRAKGTFPKKICMGKIDPIILNTLLVARTTSSIRLQYIFYFQILEFCAYYNLNAEQFSRLRNILAQPDIAEDIDRYAKTLAETFRDYFKHNDDSARMQKLLEQYCVAADVRFEIESFKDYFAADLHFDGGFSLPPLIKDVSVFESATNDQILKPIRENIEKIRNVIVQGLLQSEWVEMQWAV